MPAWSRCPERPAPERALTSCLPGAEKGGDDEADSSSPICNCACTSDPMKSPPPAVDPDSDKWWPSACAISLFALAPACIGAPSTSGTTLCACLFDVSPSSVQLLLCSPSMFESAWVRLAGRFASSCVRTAVLWPFTIVGLPTLAPVCIGALSADSPSWACISDGSPSSIQLSVCAPSGLRPGLVRLGGRTGVLSGAQLSAGADRL